MFKNLVFAAAALAFCRAEAMSPETLDIEGGKIAAALPAPDGVQAYKGLPYAAPPVAAMRWREPGPVLPWQGVRPVDKFAANCLQPVLYRDIDPLDPAMSEDCLYLNVWTAAKPGEKRPVFVWIHGGGYRGGDGAEPRHDGSVLAKKGLVVVTINYRLGVFGFMAHPELTAESTHHVSGNYAYMDMIAALRWVQKNIAVFGGDPSRVTIAGESAGSDAVSRLMASPEARGLFDRAIGESGAAFGTMPDDTLAKAEAKGKAFSDAMDRDSIAALRQRSSAEILALMLSPNHKWNFGPDIDGWIMPAPPREIFAAGKQHDVPLLVGWNADEGKDFEGMVFKTGDTLASLLKARFDGDVAAARKYYPARTPNEEERSRWTYAGDKVITQPTWDWAVAQATTGHSPVYLYRFDHHPPIPADWWGPDWAGKDLGAFHSGEIPYIFGHPDCFPSWKPTDTDRQIADVMSSAWAAFAASGDPNVASLSKWDRYDPNGTAMRMIFNDLPREEPDSDLARRKFLANHPAPSSDD